jgi:hypothetical protein
MDLGPGAEMLYRGKVTPLEGPTFQRASVWVEQEIAIAA